MEVARVKLLEHLIHEQEDIDQHRDLHDRAQGEQGLVGDAVVGEAPDDLQREDDDRRPGGEGGGQEPRSDDRGIPERAPAEADIEEGGDGVDRHRPHDGDKHKRNVKPLRGLDVAVPAVEEVAADVHVQEQVAVEHDHVPTQHRRREIELPESGNKVPEPVGPAEVDRDKSQAHQDRRHGQQLPEDDQVVELLVVVDVDRDDHHHRRRGHADEEGEVGDINAPRDLIAHAGGDQAVHQLLGVGVEAEQADHRQNAHPRVVAPVADEGDAPAAPEKNQILAGRAPHTSK